MAEEVIRQPDNVSIIGSVSILEPVTVDDGGGSLTVDAIDFDIRDLVFATDKVDVSGSTVTIGSVSGTVTANQGTPNTTVNRWPVQLTDGVDLNTITSAGEVNVLATAQPSVDIGDVTVNNAGGVSAVNIQDGGNSITVDATNLDIRDLVFATDKVDASGSVVALDSATLSALESITVQNPGGASAVNIQDGGNVISVDDAAGSFTIDTPQLPAALVGGRLDENVGAWLGSTVPTVGQKAMASSIPVTIASDQSVVSVIFNAATLAVTATAAVGVGVTLTLPAAGAGLFHFITRLGIVVNTDPVALGANSNAVVTSTNLPGGPAWLMAILRNGGGKDREDMPRVSPLRSSVANTATTIVAPATVNAIWRLNVEYFAST